MKAMLLVVLIGALATPVLTNAPVAGAEAAGHAAAPPTLKFTGAGANLQTLLDQAPAGAVVLCEQAQPLTVSHSLTIAKAITLRGFKARLPEKLGDTVLLTVSARGVTLSDLELHGNYDSVPQKNRAPLLHIKAGEFRVEQCKFFDGSKDGIMVTPDDGAGDIVGGVIRNIEGTRLGRDLVSLSGGCGGQRIRNVTVEHVRLQKSYHRGAVEVSDGADHVTVRHVYAEDAVYALDVQDHGAQPAGKAAPSAPNTNVTAEDVTAVNCRHVIRTSNHNLGHRHLTLRDFTAKNCQEPVLISNTKQVRLQNFNLSNDPEVKKPRITLRNCDDVELRNVTIVGLQAGSEPMATPNSTNLRIEGLTR